jgi:hypothetical protein
MHRRSSTVNELLCSLRADRLHTEAFEYPGYFVHRGVLKLALQQQTHEKEERQTCESG